MDKPTKREGILIFCFVVVISLVLLINYNFGKNSDIIIANTENNEENYLETESNNIEEGQTEENKDNIESNKNTEIYVDICGAVQDSKVVKLKEGDRVIDAVKLAGGLTDKADIKRINLAKSLSDGEKIIIPEIGEILSNNESFIEKNIEVKDNKVNINIANKSDLKSLNGIGDVLAERIIEYRNRNNGFKDLEEIKKVSGIGEKKFDGIRESIKLN